MSSRSQDTLVEQFQELHVSTSKTKKKRFPCEPTTDKQTPAYTVKTTISEDLVQQVASPNFMKDYPLLWKRSVQEQYISLNPEEVKEASINETDLRHIQHRLEKTHMISVNKMLAAHGVPPYKPHMCVESVDGQPNCSGTAYPPYKMYQDQVDQNNQSEDDSFYFKGQNRQMLNWSAEIQKAEHRDDIQGKWRTTTLTHLRGVQETVEIDPRLPTAIQRHQPFDVPPIFIPSVRRTPASADYHCVHFDHENALGTVDHWLTILVIRNEQKRWYVENYADPHTFFVVLPERTDVKDQTKRYCVGDSKYYCYKMARHFGFETFCILDDQINGFEHNALDATLGSTLPIVPQMTRFPLTWAAAFQSMMEVLEVTQAGLVGSSTEEPRQCDRFLVATEGGRKPNQVWMFNDKVIRANMGDLIPIHPAYQAGEDLLMHMVLFQRGVRCIKMNTIRHRKWKTGGGTCGRAKPNPYLPVERYIDYYRLCQLAPFGIVRRAKRGEKVVHHEEYVPPNKGTTFKAYELRTITRNRRVQFEGNNEIDDKDLPYLRKQLQLGQHHDIFQHHRTCKSLTYHSMLVLGKDDKILKRLKFPTSKMHIVCHRKTEKGDEYLTAQQQWGHDYGTRWILTMVLLNLSYDETMVEEESERKEQVVRGTALSMPSVQTLREDQETVADRVVRRHNQRPRK